MSDLKKILADKLRTDDLYIFDGGVVGKIKTEHRHLQVEYSVDVRQVSAKIELPHYLLSYIKDCSIRPAGDDQYNLALNFKPGKDDHFLRCVRTSLCDEINQISHATMVMINSQGKLIVCDTIATIDTILDHLTKPASRNAVLTRANDRHIGQNHSIKTFSPT